MLAMGAPVFQGLTKGVSLRQNGNGRNAGLG